MSINVVEKIRELKKKGKFALLTTNWTSLLKIDKLDIDDKEPVLPDGKCGDRADRKLGVRILASFSLAVHIAIASKFPHQLSSLAVNHLNAVLAGGVEITFAVQRLMLPRYKAMARRKSHFALPQIAVPRARPERFAPGWREL